ncbi:polyhydroxyalkanoate synthesis repressor PhaR [Nitratireductor aestuarii]|uniref:Polyhydroxyalkanoate synthesis repressor PhaR n=1 Tax=Nitratireductor aestuarii TaxID=1735103 RepID=A0A916RHS9_9HYPH|nr:polyhydroxyalkanoate synthesis repressor PhaR [Nitratireductor aestuarii]GGA56917.1 polyhydroxyalkanoate synthesis repressor PhaR [Nitratireductor aestuarii]
MPDKTEPVTIKKYANRRLYNTGTSTYVTLEDLAEMVRREEEFVVRDAKTGEDITHSVLTQIIFELENNKNGQNLLPIPFLRQIISYYGDQMEMVVPSFLEQSMQLFAKEQARMREQMQNAFGGKGIEFMEMVPMNLIEEQTKRNLQMFQEAMRMFTPSPAPTPPASEPRKEEKPQAGSPTNGDLQELREQLAAMQRKIDSLSK